MTTPYRGRRCVLPGSKRRMSRHLFAAAQDVTPVVAGPFTEAHLAPGKQARCVALLDHPVAAAAHGTAVAGMASKPSFPDRAA